MLSSAYRVLPTCILTSTGFVIHLNTLITPATTFPGLVNILHQKQHDFPIPRSEYPSRTIIYTLVDTQEPRRIYDSTSWDDVRPHLLLDGPAHLIMTYAPSTPTTHTHPFGFGILVGAMTSAPLTPPHSYSSPDSPLGTEIPPSPPGHDIPLGRPVVLYTPAGSVSAPPTHLSVAHDASYHAFLTALAQKMHHQLPLVAAGPCHIGIFDGHGGMRVLGAAEDFRGLAGVGRVEAVFDAPIREVSENTLHAIGLRDRTGELWEALMNIRKVGRFVEALQQDLDGEHVRRAGSHDHWLVNQQPGRNQHPLVTQRHLRSSKL